MYTLSMRQALISLAVLLSISLTAVSALAQSEARLKPFDWPNDSTFEFGIFDKTGARIATAYYRILKEELQGQAAYRLKYVGRNEQTSEASECWIHPDSLLPLRSTRKLVAGGGAFYLDVAYGSGVIVIRRKYEGEEPSQQELPTNGRMYDYESLLWLIPQIDFGPETQARLNIFDTLNYIPATVVVNDLGEQQLTVKDHTYPAHAYSFEVSLTPYLYWTVMQEGRAVPARFDPGGNSFINLNLDPAKCTAKAPAPKPAPAKPVPASTPPEDDGSGDGSENPLGPPPPGGRF